MCERERECVCVYTVYKRVNTHRQTLLFALQADALEGGQLAGVLVPRLVHHTVGTFANLDDFLVLGQNIVRRSSSRRHDFRSVEKEGGKVREVVVALLEVHTTVGYAEI